MTDTLLKDRTRPDVAMMSPWFFVSALLGAVWPLVLFYVAPALFVSMVSILANPTPLAFGLWAVPVVASLALSFPFRIPGTSAGSWLILLVAAILITQFGQLALRVTAGAVGL